MVVTLNVKNYDVYRILINNRSLVDILYYYTLLKMGISFEQLIRVNSPLIGFIGDAIQVERMITLTERM